MRKLEESIYNNFFKDAVLRVTKESAKFYYYGLNVTTTETYPIQDIGLENFCYLQSFLNNENHYMELSMMEIKNYILLFYVVHI